MKAEMIKKVNEMISLKNTINEYKNKITKLEEILSSMQKEENIELWHERRAYLSENHESFDPYININIEINPRCPDCGHIERPYRGCQC
jgi:hypothetical protein